MIISYFFPPAGGVCVQRVLSLAKYLPSDQCEVFVLTTRNGRYPVTDATLLPQVPLSVRIFRSFTPELPYYLRRRLWNGLGAPSHAAKACGTDTRSRFRPLLETALSNLPNLLAPDPQVVWVRFATRAAANIITKYQCDTVLVTAPPFSSLMIGVALKRPFPNVRLVSDFRDDWFYYLASVDSMPSDYKHRMAMRLEGEVIAHSDLVVAVTESSLLALGARHPHASPDKFALIPNGYEPSLVKVSAPKPGRCGIMRVAYLGTVYRPCSPKYYLAALDTLSSDIRQNVETHFIGRVIDSEQSPFQHCRSKIILHGFMPQKQAVTQAEQCDFLLLIVDDERSLPGKLFEYMAMGKPILALTPQFGETARLIREARSGEVANPSNITEIARLIGAAYQRFRRNEHEITPNWEVVRRYERPRLAEEYRRLIEHPRPETSWPHSVTQDVVESRHRRLR